MRDRPRDPFDDEDFPFMLLMERYKSDCEKTMKERAEIARKGRAEGLSYGQYVAKYKIP